MIGGKGTGASGDPKTTTEYLADPKLMVDAGSLLGGAPNKFDVGVGYEWWLNKFGDEKYAQKPPLPDTAERRRLRSRLSLRLS